MDSEYLSEANESKATFVNSTFSLRPFTDYLGPFEKLCACAVHIVHHGHKGYQSRAKMFRLVSHCWPVAGVGWRGEGEVERRSAMPTGGPSAHFCTTRSTSQICI